MVLRALRKGAQPLALLAIAGSGQTGFCRGAKGEVYYFADRLGIRPVQYDEEFMVYDSYGFYMVRVYLYCPS